MSAKLKTQPDLEASDRLSTGRDSRRRPRITAGRNGWFDRSSRNRFPAGRASRTRSIGGMYTYFIQREDGGPIKIGKTKNIDSRVGALQPGSPVTLYCIGYLEGDFEEELHERFHDLCIAGEWFRDDPTLTDLIETYAIPARIGMPLRTPEQIAARREARRNQVVVRCRGRGAMPGANRKRLVPPWRIGV